MQEKPPTRRRLTKRGKIVLSIVLVLILLLAGIVYSQRHQIGQTVRNLTLPPAQAVRITPLTLTATSTSAPGQTNSDDWTMYHNDLARTGFIAGAPDPTQFASLWKQALDGAVYTEPLVVNGKVIVATENDTLYALNAQSGQILWHTHVGTPVPLSDLPCGNINPLGITGTPAYDPQTGLIFAVAEVQGPGHVLVGVDAQSGQVKVRRVVDPPNSNPQAQQQRPALALEDGRVYIGFGGLDGDCGQYHGWLVASRTDGTGPLLTYQVPSPREGAIWATSGPVIDQQGNIYVTVGNGAVTQGTWDHTDSVLRFSPTLQLEDAFAPQSWASDNADDLDLGSMGPILLPNGALFTHGKSGQGYLLQANHLGGIGGQTQTLSLCSAGAYGGAAVRGQTAFIPCANGLHTITLGTDGRVSAGWHAPSQVTGSPIVGGNTVYALDPGNGTLYALNAGTGSVRATIAVGTTNRFASPTLYHTTVFVGTLTGVTAVSIS
jgi:outer membrane protein assembly factor BamB